METRCCRRKEAEMATGVEEKIAAARARVADRSPPAPSVAARRESALQHNKDAAGAVWMPMPPCPAHQKKPGAVGIEAENRQRSGAKLRSPAQLRSTASTGQSTACSNRSIAVATSISSGAASHGSTGDLVERADPDAAVALALEIETVVEVGDQRQIAQAAAADAQLDQRPPLRRIPIGATPQRAATSSAHAPAGIDQHRRADRTAGQSRPPRPPPDRRRAQRRIGPHRAARRGESPRGRQHGRPRPRCRRSSARTRRRSTARASRGSSGRARRGRDGQRMLAGQLFGALDRSPCGPVRCNGPRRRSNGVASPASRRRTSLATRSSAGAPGPRRRLASQKAAERPVE